MSEKYNLNIGKMGINLPFDSYLSQQKQIKTLESQNESFKKATKGLVVVLAKVPDNIKYESYTQIGKLEFIDVRYEGVYEFMSNINENLKKITDERVVKITKDKLDLEEKNKKLEYKLKKLANESSVIAANMSLLEKIQFLGSENKSLKKQISDIEEKAKSELKNYKDLYEKLKIEFDEQQNSLKRTILQEEIANKKIEEISLIKDSLNKTIVDLKSQLECYTKKKSPISKIINLFYEKRKRCKRNL